MSAWTLFEILLTSAIVCKQKLLYENEIVQYLQHKNTKTLIRATLESPYKLLQTPQKIATLGQSTYFFMGRLIFTYFIRKFLTFALLWQNQSNYIFKKLHFSLLQQAKIHITTSTQ